MNNQSLLQYLSIALPTIPLQGVAPSRNTTNPRYGAADITQVVDWAEFSYATIIQRYGGILNAKQIASDPFRSPPAAIRDEPHFHLRFAELLLPRVRRALRAGFEELAPRLQQLSLVPITFDGGGSAAFIDQFRPDTAFVILGGTYADSTNRAPGDIKVSWKWRSDFRHSPIPAVQDQYKQVLSQVKFYMDQHNARHGFVLTNTELVAVKRLDRNGRLAVSVAIPWTAGGHGQLTVLMGMWYLGMLAAEEGNWTL
ncbi:hypothetical protein BO70DRAFT_364426 [Aspergillus heteromorphus CBS 117.55]|uniref:Uncharacterized protein n=1 Tax=Aspergillus heteromorphus CBS 117.55 TaxID=1448321 RepID=A0A317VNM2_9EURO|nr:uncharacterized protein BO70DRAFT_364426 [Aspergillus heteromorphus CBS 117.55]PWY74452.1 hypothetical protein BO70DRAFT_364426 [Aspergillus heteromorphus CBS 117.55]